MLIHADAIQAMKELEANSVDSIVTDPPYGLGFMGKEWDSLPPGQEVFEKCLRVLKPGGHLLCFGGSRTYHRMAVAVEDAGFEIRDQIMWVYGSGFPKSQNIGKAVDKIQGNEREETHKETKADSTYHTQNVGEEIKNTSTYSVTKGHSQWEGYGTALKPAHEPIVLARKPIEKGLSIAHNCLKWGLGAINVDGCRVGYEGGTAKKNPPKDKSENTYGNGINGNCGIDDIGKGRFPANFIHDGSDEVVGLFPVTSSGKLKQHHNGGQHESTSNTYGKFYSGTIGEKHGKDFGGDTGSAARFFYTAKAKKKERLTFNNHPTVKPVSLMQYLVRLITPAGGTCLDPFAGSGTTGLACLKEGRSYILIDKDGQTIDIARRRLLSEIASREWPLRHRYQQKTAQNAYV